MCSLAAVALASLVLPAVSPAQKPKPPAKDAPTVAGDVGKKLDQLVQQFESGSGGFSGSVLVARDGKILLEKGYGVFDADAKKPMPVDAMWDWASVSKQFTATALLRLQDKKKVKLDDALAKFWPKAPADKKDVTVRLLLNHASGIESGFKSEWKFDARKRESLEELVLGLPMTSRPGDTFDYSNSGYAMCAALIEKLTGDTFEKFCVDEVFRPAGMQDACFIGWKSLDLGRVPKIDRGQGFTDRPKDFRFAYGNELSWGYRGCGGVVATTRDLLAWDRALRGGKFLSKDALEQLYQPAKLRQPAKDEYALGWFVRQSRHGRRVDHSGGVLGVITQYFRLLDQDVVVALACNFTPKGDPAVLAEQLVDAASK